MTREEAIKIVHNATVWTDEERHALGLLIPELAESEKDKSLADTVIAELGKYNGNDYWKAPWALDSTGLQYPLYFANLGAKWQKEQKPAECIDDSAKFDEECKTGREVEVREGIESVKPAEWSEEDKKILDILIRSLARIGANTRTDSTSINYTFGREIAWLSELPKRFSLQPKQEHCDYTTPHKKFFQWIYDRLIYVHHENPDVDYMRSFKERINNLSFNETTYWKPNEEQIEALKDVIDRALLTCRQQVPLESLYNDIKNIKNNENDKM